MGMSDRCTCEPPSRGPPWDDGYAQGMCPHCEEEAWRDAHGWRDEDLQEMADGGPSLTLDDFLSLIGEDKEGDNSHE